MRISLITGVNKHDAVWKEERNWAQLGSKRQAARRWVERVVYLGRGVAVVKSEETGGTNLGAEAILW